MPTSTQDLPSRGEITKFHEDLALVEKKFSNVFGAITRLNDGASETDEALERLDRNAGSIASEVSSLQSRADYLDALYRGLFDRVAALEENSDDVTNELYALRTLDSLLEEDDDDDYDRDSELAKYLSLFEDKDENASLYCDLSETDECDCGEREPGDTDYDGPEGYEDEDDWNYGDSVSSETVEAAHANAVRDLLTAEEVQAIYDTGDYSDEFYDNYDDFDFDDFETAEEGVLRKAYAWAQVVDDVWGGPEEYDIAPRSVSAATAPEPELATRYPRFLPALNGPHKDLDIRMYARTFTMSFFLRSFERPSGMWDTLTYEDRGTCVCLDATSHRKYLDHLTFVKRNPNYSTNPLSMAWRVLRDVLVLPSQNHNR